MARLNDSKDCTYLSAVATSAITSQYTIVKFNSDENDIVACGDGEKPLGVLESKAAAGETVAVTITGTCLVKLGDTVTDQSYVASDASGLCVTAAQNDKVLGFMPTGGAVGELRSVILAGPGGETVKL